jgi:predicted butyrate kinase (DUF1464 family)
MYGAHQGFLHNELAYVLLVLSAIFSKSGIYERKLEFATGVRLFNVTGCCGLTAPQRADRHR